MNSENMYVLISNLHICNRDSDVTQSCTENSELRLPARNVHEILPVDSRQYRPLLPSTKRSCLLHPLLFLHFNFQKAKERTFSLFMQNWLVSSMNEWHGTVN